MESYQKIQKAVLDDRIRLENERRREILQKTGKTITEAQKRRNEENRRKYEIGGAVLAAFKKLDIKIETDTPEQIHNRIVNSHQFVSKVRSTQIFKQIVQQQNNFFKDRIYLLMCLKVYQLGQVGIKNYQPSKLKNTKINTIAKVLLNSP